MTQPCCEHQVHHTCIPTSRIHQHNSTHPMPGQQLRVQAAPTSRALPPVSREGAAATGSCCQIPRV